MPDTGTRRKQAFYQGMPPTGQFSRTDTRDLGKSKRVKPATLTFTAPNAILAAVGAQFAPFVVGDRIEILGTNSNNGTHQILSCDANQNMTVSRGAKTEGPIANCSIGQE